MATGAHILSVGQLEIVKEALAKFSAKASETLGGAEMEVRRSLEHLKERERHWQRVIRQLTEEVARLRSAVAFAKSREGGGTGEKELELRKAQQKLREAEQKLEAVHRWQRQLPDAIREFEGPVRKLRGFLESDVNQALAFLEERMIAIEGYLSTVAPTVPSEKSTGKPAATQTAAPAGESTAQPVSGSGTEEAPVTTEPADSQPAATAPEASPSPETQEGTPA